MQVEFDQVSVTREGRPVLAGVQGVYAQRRVGVIGPNGAGKSTLARLLNGLVLPSQGRVRVQGTDTREDVRAVRRQVGFVFQNPDHQIVFPIVEEDMGFGLRNAGVPRAEIGPRVQAQLEALGIAHLAERASHALSGGEKQLVALAAVLVMQPGLVVLDEPSTFLDLRHRARLRRLLATLPQTIWLVTHDLDMLAEFDHVLVVADGGLAFEGPPAQAIAWYVQHHGE